MKTIGLLGGTSWPSTIDYYRILNELAQERFGGHHSADLILRSIDYHEIKSQYHEGWEEIPALLGAELSHLARLQPACILLCNNTLHKALDALGSSLDLGVPVMHIVRETGARARDAGIRNVLLLGTKFTMEDGYYARELEQFGLTVSIPEAAERDEIQIIQSELARGRMELSYREYFDALLRRYASLDAAVLACTELPLAIEPSTAPMAILNPTRIQCEAAFRFATA